MTENPNVLFVVLDTARADTVYSLLEENMLPGVNKYAKDGLTFDNAYANGPWTFPSHASMFTGQRTSNHGSHAGTKEFDPDYPVLAELFSEAGYDTRGISCNSWVTQEFGFERGFDYLSTKYDRYWGGADISRLSQTSGVERLKTIPDILINKKAPKTLLNILFTKHAANFEDKGARRVTDRTINWLNQRSSKQPFFLFINYLEPHGPYNPPKEYKNRFVGDGGIDDVTYSPWEYIAGNLEISEEDFNLLYDLYRSEISYLDSHLNRLFDFLDGNGILDDTICVLVGDHGENIGDHNLMDHQYSLHETLLNVPLIIRYPNKIQSGTHSGLIELRDLYSIITNLAELEIPDNETVSSLKYNNSRNMVFAEYRYPQPSIESLKKRVTNPTGDWNKLDRTLRSVRTDTWKLIEADDGEVWLFNAGEEAEDISKSNPGTVRNLKEIMDQNNIRLGKGKEKSRNVSKATEERLNDLGYI